MTNQVIPAEAVIVDKLSELDWLVDVVADAEDVA
jgi:hypothetical protein